SLWKLAFSVAIVDDTIAVEKVADAIGLEPRNMAVQWSSIPRECRPALLHSLGRIMRPSTRRILSSRLLAKLRDEEVSAATKGKLLYQAGELGAAIETILQAAERGDSREAIDNSLKLLDMALDAAQRIKDTEREGTVRLKIACLHKDLGDITGAETHYLRTIDLLERAGHESIIARAFRQLGDLYKDKSDYAAGIKVLNNARDIYTRLEDDEGLSHTFNNLGNMYWIAGRLDDALEHYMKSLETRKGNGSEQVAAITMSNIGTVFCVKGDYAKGIDFFNQSLQIKEKLGNKGEIAQTYNNLGLASFLLGNVGEAIEAYTRALRLNDEIGDELELLINIANLAEVMIQAGRMSEALKYLRQGRAVVDKLDDNTHRCVLFSLTGNLMRRMGYFDDAGKMLADAVGIAEALNNKSLLLPCHINMTHLHFALNGGETAEKHAATARTIAESLGDKNALFQIALLEMQLGDSERARIEAEKLLGELNTPREEALFSLITIERNNRGGITDDSGPYLEHAGTFFDGQRQDVDQPRYYMAAGASHRLSENNKDARECYERAGKLAEKLKLLPEQWQAAAALSELSFAERDFETSFAHARQATTVLKQIAARIKNPDQLGRFYNSKTIVDLLGRIKSLHSLLAKTKGAVR
ncbi:MAG: tetratricopeptide repeat protein, partial [Candidatus Thorarchaeota archaeon]